MDIYIDQPKPAKVAKLSDNLEINLQVPAENQQDPSIISLEVNPLLPIMGSLLSEFNLLKEEFKKRENKDMEAQSVLKKKVEDRDTEMQRRDAEVKKLRTDHHDLTTRLSGCRKGTKCSNSLIPIDKSQNANSNGTFKGSNFYKF